MSLWLRSMLTSTALQVPLFSSSGVGSAEISSRDHPGRITPHKGKATQHGGKQRGTSRFCTLVNRVHLAAVSHWGTAPSLENGPSLCQDWEITKLDEEMRNKKEKKINNKKKHPTTSHRGSFIVSNSCSRNSAFVFAGFSFFFLPSTQMKWSMESKGPVSIRSALIVHF